VWVEAAGMLPMIANVAHGYGVSVHSSGGYESITAKYGAGVRIAERAVPTTVLSLGDYDPSGLSILDAAAEDVAAFAAQLGGRPPTMTRLAVTPTQIRRHQLPTAPQKRTDRRGAHMPATVQAEALAPDQLTAIVTRALDGLVDRQALDAVRVQSALERRALLAWIERA
jgi:hypothetical protein